MRGCTIWAGSTRSSASIDYSSDSEKRLAQIVGFRRRTIRGLVLGRQVSSASFLLATHSRRFCRTSLGFSGRIIPMDRDAASPVRRVCTPPDIRMAQRGTRRFHSLGYYLVGVCRVLRYICGALCLWLLLREFSSDAGQFSRSWPVACRQRCRPQEPGNGHWQLV